MSNLYEIRSFEQQTIDDLKALSKLKDGDEYEISLPIEVEAKIILQKLNKQKEVLDKIKEYLEITKLIYDDDTCVMLCETWYGKELMKLLEEIE